MEILKIDIRLSETGEWKICDAILLENQVWLVGRWLENKELGLAKPERLIQIPWESLHQPPPELPHHQYVLSEPIALGILHGTEESQYMVREEPTGIVVSLNLVSPIVH